MQEARKRIYTVSQVNALIKAALQENLPSQLLVRGQVTNFRPHQSGHAYFSLKDDSSVLPCTMWRSNFSKLKFEFENGMEILATGFIDIYVPRGQYQLIVERVEPAGKGALQLAFEQLYQKLRAEGLFDDKYKKSLPAYPQRIGILTSQSGAAIEDIKNSIYNRWPCARLFFYPVPVQGEGAAEVIAAAIKDINKRNKTLNLEVLIVGRGGGSMEDLWAFNEEVLARAIFGSKIPIISAVGHEIDTTIADFVADARASTPTKAGVVAVPDVHEVCANLAYTETKLFSEVTSRMDSCRARLREVLAGRAFREPLFWVHYSTQRVDLVAVGLQDCIKSILLELRQKFYLFYERVRQLEPHRFLSQRRIELASFESRADTVIRKVLNECQRAMEANANRLAVLNPRSVLKRGYSITTNKGTGKVITRAGDVAVDDIMVTELAGRNLIESRVTKK